MILLGWMSLALGLGELAAGGMSGAPRKTSDAIRGVLSSVVLLALGAACFELPAGRWGIAIAFEAVLAGAWLCLRTTGDGPASPGPPPPGRRAIAAIAALTIGWLAAFVAFADWRVDLRPWLVRWLAHQPLASLRDHEPARLALVLGAGSLLLATSNGIVRALLQVADTRDPRAGEGFRGGRYIGAIERWIIFGLALAGEPTAAALVVSAKSLLRFPELSKSAQDASNDGGGVDVLTEYFLLGSLSSWGLALLAAALARA